jgi:ActD protein
MAVKKFVVGIFTDEEVLFPAIRKVRQAGYKIHDVYTPMPIHGMDKALGLRDTSLHTAGFIYGITGTTTALCGIGWVFNVDWPVNIGGKSHFDLPAWIPITFELTVLFSAVGMFLTFCWLCQMAPFVRKHHFNLRSTDDQFTMVIEVLEKNNEEQIKAFLTSVGATGINTQVAEAGWWMGRYDTDKTPFQHTGKDSALA